MTPASPGSPVIEVEGVTKSFGPTRALNGVDLQAESGRVLALLGPNGAGKTTLVRVLTTLITPDSGRARVAGYDVVADAARLRAVIGLAGQFAAVDELLTGRENLELVGRLYHLPVARRRRRAQEVLERFGLTDAADRIVKGYSGGMRRRLDLGASLVARPSVLILDEPTTGLDPASRNDVWEHITELVDEGTTVLLTTQYLEEADRLAHRIVVVDEGRVIAEGTSDELKDRMGGDVLEARVADVADLERAGAILAEHGEGQSTVEVDQLRVSVPIRTGAKGLVAAGRALDDGGIALEDLGIRRPSLDDVFLALTGHVTTESGTVPDSHDTGPQSLESEGVAMAATSTANGSRKPRSRR
jgi:ABC-2 type transport system ATP-binding protein